MPLIHRAHDPNVRMKCGKCPGRFQFARLPHKVKAKAALRLPILSSCPDNVLSDAVLRAIGAAESIGVRAILVHAISDEAKTFYEKHGFRPSPIEPMTLMITIEEARRMLR
jgi:hypothetical protein